MIRCKCSPCLTSVIVQVDHKTFYCTWVSIAGFLSQLSSYLAKVSTITKSRVREMPMNLGDNQLIVTRQVGIL